MSAYRRMLGHLPRAAVDYLSAQALVRCKWFPTIAECKEIVASWERDDEAVQAKREATRLAQVEHQARLEDAARDLKLGKMDQATVDALPDLWKRILETRSLLLRHNDGTYTARPVLPEPD